MRLQTPFRRSWRGDPSGPHTPRGIIDHVIITGTLSVFIGATTPLTATAYDALGVVVLGAGVSWRTNAPLIATVSSSGVVTGVGTGNATITATVDGRDTSVVVASALDPFIAFQNAITALGLTASHIALRDVGQTRVTGTLTNWVDARGAGQGFGGFTVPGGNKPTVDANGVVNFPTNSYLQWTTGFSGVTDGVFIGMLCRPSTAGASLRVNVNLGNSSLGTILMNYVNTDGTHTVSSEGSTQTINGVTPPSNVLQTVSVYRQMVRASGFYEAGIRFGSSAAQTTVASNLGGYGNNYPPNAFTVNALWDGTFPGNVADVSAVVVVTGVTDIGASVQLAGLCNTFFHARFGLSIVTVGELIGFGNSFIAGQGASDPNTTSFIHRIGADAKLAGYVVTQLGHSGQDGQSMMDRFSGAERISEFAPAVDAERPDRIAVLYESLNDISVALGGGATNQQASDRAYNSLVAMVQLAQRAGCNRVRVLTPTNETAGGVNPNFNTVRLDVRSRLIANAASLGVVAVDLNADATIQSSINANDGIHPTDNGHQAIANLVLATL